MLVANWKEQDRFNRNVQNPWMPLLHQVDEMFNELLSPGTWPESPRNFVQAYDVQETEDHYLVSFDIPGVERNDLSIEIEGTRLTVSGERKTDGDRKGAANRPSRYGKFQQVFTLPEGVKAEGVEANYKDGVLTLMVQKPSTARPTKIRIGDGASAGKSGFLKNLIGDKKSGPKDSVEIKPEPQAAMAN